MEHWNLLVTFIVGSAGSFTRTKHLYGAPTTSSSSQGIACDSHELLRRSISALAPKQLHLHSSLFSVCNRRCNDGKHAGANARRHRYALGFCWKCSRFVECGERLTAKNRNGQSGHALLQKKSTKIDYYDAQWRIAERTRTGEG